MIARRSLITGLASLIAAPALVRAGSLMPVSVEPVKLIRPIWHPTTVFHRGDGIWVEVYSEYHVTRSGAVLYRALGGEVEAKLYRAVEDAARRTVKAFCVGTN